MNQRDLGIVQHALTFEQLVIRCAMQTTVALADDVSRDKIVASTIVGADITPRLAVVVHPETYRRACNKAYERFGVGLRGIAGSQPSADFGFRDGQDYVVIVSRPSMVLLARDKDYAAEHALDSSVEWRIRL